MAERTSRTGSALVPHCAEGALAAGLMASTSKHYKGDCEWLNVVGVGAAPQCAARDAHVAKGRPVACWDMAYLGKTKDLVQCYVRVSLNTDHPTHEAIEATEPDPKRFNKFGVLMEDGHYRPDGHVLVIGMGSKSHNYLGEHDWEARTLRTMERRFPGRRIVYRPKPLPVRSKRAPDGVRWPDKSVGVSLDKALKGASLLVCRHSNSAVEACRVGVPVECEGGAAHWLYSQTPIPGYAERRDFLYRLLWWQWRFHEMREAWQFLIPKATQLGLHRNIKGES